MPPTPTRRRVGCAEVSSRSAGWLVLNREGIPVARCTVERLMAELGLAGVRRGRRVRTTHANAAAARAQDLVQRRFNPPAPDRTWVADFTYVPTWSGMVYVAFVIDAYSRRILGWRAATTMRTSLVLDALEQALWTRNQAGVQEFNGLIHHTDAGTQYTSIAFTERLAQAGAAPSVGSVGDAYDNALAETVIGLFKTELVKPHGPWRTVEQVEIATLEWIDWFNNRRLFQACGDIPPVELEHAHYRQHAALTEAGHSTPQASGHTGAIHFGHPPECCRCWLPPINTFMSRVTDREAGATICMRACLSST